MKKLSKSPLYQQLVDAYNQRNSDGNAAQEREQAFTAFVEKGFPSNRDEDWKFTNIAPFLADDYSFELQEPAAAILENAVQQARVPGLDSYMLVLVNGKINGSLSILPDASCFKLQQLSEISDVNYFNTYKSEHVGAGNRMLALNTALFNEGYLLEVPASIIWDKPLHVIQLFAGEQNLFIQNRNVLVMGRFSGLEVIESVISLQEGHKLFVNNVTQVKVAEQASLIQYQIQHNQAEDRLIDFLEVVQEKNSRYDHFSFNLPGAELIRNNLEIVLNGSATETHLMGLYLVGDHQLTDNHTAIHHLFPNCDSNEIYKGVLLGKGKAVFNGKVFVERPAQKTNAFQQNNNLLLSDKAQVFAKPQLEIFADDVKCSHGCTVGQFDPESLFYLRSRGIGEDSARKLLVEAFMFDVTQRITNEPVKEYVQSLIYEKMENSFADTNTSVYG